MESNKDLTQPVTDLEGESVFRSDTLSKSQLKEVQEKIEQLTSEGKNPRDIPVEDVMPALTYERLLLTLLKTYVPNEEYEEDAFLVPVVFERILSNPKEYEEKHKEFMKRVVSFHSMKVKDGKATGAIEPWLAVNVTKYLGL